MSEIYRLMPADPMATDFGCLFPVGTERVEVCDDDCPVGKYRLVYPSPRRFRWSGGHEGDLAAAAGPNAALPEALALLREGEPDLRGEPFETLPSADPSGERVLSRYVLLRPSCEVIPLASSTMAGGVTCPRCGQIGPFRILGVETTRTERVEGELRSVSDVPRQAGAGLHVARCALAGREIFAFGNMVLCTVAARKRIESGRLTNLAFHAYGEIVGD